VISLLSRNKDCVTEISACEILGQFLRTMKDDDFQKQRVLETLSGLINAPQLVKEAHSKGKLFVLIIVKVINNYFPLFLKVLSFIFWINFVTPIMGKLVKRVLN
jgi:hypothetical protein